jgi:ADP-ribose pyrophosphatase YjhB (NUDIX family)
MPYKFCPKCGGHLDDRLIEEHERLVCGVCGFIFYRNSKPCSSVLILQEGKVLLVRRMVEPFLGWWDIPGGFLEPGEHPEEGAIRETREETGLEVELVSLLGMWMDVYGADNDPTLNLCYIGQITGGQEKAGTDAGELAWFAIRTLPEKIAFAWSNVALKALQIELGGCD